MLPDVEHLKWVVIMLMNLKVLRPSFPCLNVLREHCNNVSSEWSKRVCYLQFYSMSDIHQRLSPHNICSVHSIHQMAGTQHQKLAMHLFIASCVVFTTQRFYIMCLYDCWHIQLWQEHIRKVGSVIFYLIPLWLLQQRNVSHIAEWRKTIWNA